MEYWLLILALVLVLVLLWMSKGPKVAIVSLVKEPHNLRTWVDYHKNKMNVDRFYLFADDDHEDLAPGDPSVIIIKNWKERLGYKFNNEIDEPANVRVRQEMAFNEAMRLANTEGIKYLVHIDSDELLWGPRPSQVFQKYPEALSFHMQNDELAPDRMDYENCFVEGTKFHSDPRRYTAYGNGKAAGVVGKSTWHGPHYILSENVKEISELRILHYPSCNIKETLKRARQYGNFQDNSAGWSEHHKMTRDALMGCGDDCEEKAREVFKHRMADETSKTIRAI